MKHLVKCWECGGHHLCRYCPAMEHKEGSSHKVPRLLDKPRAENQQEKFWEAEGLGPEHSKKIIEHGTCLQNFEILMCKLYMYWNTEDGVIPRGRGL